MVPLLYVMSILIANVLTTIFNPINLGGLIIPCGSLLVGATFVLRDYVQNQYGRKKTYALIILAMILSALCSLYNGDALWITLASISAFLVSEITDTEVFSRVVGAFQKKVLLSGILGGAIDSFVFVVIGLSPIGTGVLTWGIVPYAILGQLFAKIILQILFVFIVLSIVNAKRDTAARG